MTRRASLAKLDRPKTLRLALVALSLAACSDGDAQKSWNELSTCLAGPAAQSPLATRVAQLRSIASATQRHWVRSPVGPHAAQGQRMTCMPRLARAARGPC